METSSVVLFFSIVVAVATMEVRAAEKVFTEARKQKASDASDGRKERKQQQQQQQQQQRERERTSDGTSDGNERTSDEHGTSDETSDDAAGTAGKTSDGKRRKEAWLEQLERGTRDYYVESSQVSEHRTGRKWIVAGSSFLAIFSIGAIALILLNLEKLGRAGRKNVSNPNNKTWSSASAG